MPYDVVFSGFKPQVDLQHARAAISHALNFSPDQARRLFEQLPTVIATDLSEPEATALRDRVRAAGGVCRAVAAGQAETRHQVAPQAQAAPRVLATCPKCGYGATTKDDPLLTAYDGLGECPECGLLPGKYREAALSDARAGAGGDAVVDAGGQPIEHFVGSTLIGPRTSRQSWSWGWRLGLVAIAIAGIALLLPGISPQLFEPVLKNALMPWRQQHGAALTRAGTIAVQTTFQNGLGPGSTDPPLPPDERLDPWGQPYRFLWTRKGEPVLHSSGPDRRFNPSPALGDDDILILGGSIAALNEPPERLLMMAMQTEFEPLLLGLLNAEDATVAREMRKWLNNNGYIVIEAPGLVPHFNFQLANP